MSDAAAPTEARTEVESVPDSDAPDLEDEDIDDEAYWSAVTPIDPNSALANFRLPPRETVELPPVAVNTGAALRRPPFQHVIHQPVASTSRTQTPSVIRSPEGLPSPAPPIVRQRAQAPASPTRRAPASVLQSSPDSQPIAVIRISSGRKGKQKAVVPIDDDDDESLPPGPSQQMPASPPRPLRTRSSSPVASMPTSAPVASTTVEAPLPAGRPMRKRNQAQLNPFSHERAKYLGTLVRNDWQDAVVIEKARRGETDADRRAKRARLDQQGADDLDGWLDLEGRPTRVDDEEETYDERVVRLERDDFELIGIARPARLSTRRLCVCLISTDRDRDKGPAPAQASSKSRPAPQPSKAARRPPDRQRRPAEGLCGNLDASLNSQHA